MRRPVVVLAAALSTLVACTGARPSLGATVAVGGTTGSAVGDEATDLVLQRLEQSPPQPFTATYELQRKFGERSTAATVVQDGERTSVTVGDVRFLIGARNVTCMLATGECEDGTLDARISDFSVPATFFAASPARALRVAYARKSAPTAGSDTTVAGVACKCVDVPVGAGHDRYCATEMGPIAEWDTAAVHVELTALTATADPAAFDVPA